MQTPAFTFIRGQLENGDGALDVSSPNANAEKQVARIVSMASSRLPRERTSWKLAV